MLGKYRKFFFPRVRLSIGRFLQKIWTKTHFSIFTKRQQTTSDTENPDFSTIVWGILVGFWIRVKNPKSFLLHYSKHDLDSNWLIYRHLKILRFWHFSCFFHVIFALKIETIFDFLCKFNRQFSTHFEQTKHNYSSFPPIYAASLCFEYFAPRIPSLIIAFLQIFLKFLVIFMPYILTRKSAFSTQKNMFSVSSKKHNFWWIKAYFSCTKHRKS